MSAQRLITIEHKLQALHLQLPKKMIVPAGTLLPFPFVKIHKNLAYISGHLPLEPDGAISLLRGKVGEDVSIEEAYRSARDVGLAILSSLKDTLGYLNRVKSWIRVFGMVNAVAHFEHHPKVINGFSDLIRELYGTDAGYPARSAIGVGSLPFQVPVEIEALVEITSEED